MAKQEPIEMTAVVQQKLPNAKFRIKLDNGHEIIGHISGRIRKHNIRIQPGDKVRCEMSPYDLTKGRITYRLSGAKKVIKTDDEQNTEKK